MKRLYGTADLEAELFEDSGVPVEEAMKQVAADRGVPKREIYQYFISDK